MEDLHQKQLKKPHHGKIQQPSIYGWHPVPSPVFIQESRPKQGGTQSGEPHMKTGISLCERQVPNSPTPHPTLLLSTSHPLACTAPHSHILPPYT